MNICCVGDVFAGGELAYHPEMEPFSRGILDILGNGDHVIANLESPVMAPDSIHNAKPPFPDKPLQVSTVDTFDRICKHFNVVSLANNHIFDYGRESLEETIEVLDRKGIGHTGAAGTWPKQGNRCPGKWR